MPVFKWRRRDTRYFGEVWVPFAEVELRRADGGWQSFAIQVDSGAVISLLRCSVAALLGIQLKDGTKIDFGAVGGSRVVAYRHDLECRFGEEIKLRVPFAIAEREDVPNLLGRLGIFDVLQVDFDASVHETRIAAPWLDGEGERMWSFLLEVESHILERWGTNPLPGRADEAARRLVQRSAQLLAAVAGLVKLHRGYEAPLLIRAMLELSVQLEYLLESPEERAEQYLEYEHVSRYRQMSAVLDDPQGKVAGLLANSAQRAAREKRVCERYDRVRKRFLVWGPKGKKKVSGNWYMMGFRQLSEHMGRLPEYKLWYKRCSAWSHADPFGVARPSLLDDKDALVVAMWHHGRVLKLVADQKRVILSPEQYEGLTELAKGIV